LVPATAYLHESSGPDGRFHGGSAAARKADVWDVHYQHVEGILTDGDAESEAV